MTNRVHLRWGSDEGLERFQNSISHLSPHEVARLGARALNHTGAKAVTAVKGALAIELGMSKRAVGTQLRSVKATASRSEFRIVGTGDDIPLKFFKPRETRSGVVASPFGRKRIFPGAFMKGGLFPKRVGTGTFGGHVVERYDGSKRWPVRRVQSGVSIPKAMVQGAAATAFRRSMEDLPRRFAHEVDFARDLDAFTGGARF